MIGGLVTATLLTLLVLPALYPLVMDEGAVLGGDQGPVRTEAAQAAGGVTLAGYPGPPPGPSQARCRAARWDGGSSGPAPNSFSRQVPGA